MEIAKGTISTKQICLANLLVSTFTEVQVKMNTAFCPKCGALLIPSIDKKNMACSCGYSSRKAELSLREKGNCEKDYKVKEESAETLAKVKEKCPKCKNIEAFNWSLQTRATDEAETQFYRCCKCSHTWREYA